MNQYLYRIQPTRLEMVTNGPTHEEASILSEHFNYLQSLTKQGVVLVFGRTQNNDPSTFGITIFRADSENAARSIMNNDPAVKKGLMRAELFPYKVAGLNASNWASD
ncbi:MAG: YciI family protein [Candidatus Bathyarchaeia archaeon]